MLLCSPLPCGGRVGTGLGALLSGGGASASRTLWLSEDSLWRLAQEEAARLEAVQPPQIEASAAFPDPIYQATTDGIGVKAQKPTRQKRGEPPIVSPEKRHDTDVMLRFYENLAIAAHSRPEREEWERQIAGLLWGGQTEESLTYVRGLRVRHAKAPTELIGSVEKRASEIIDDERRLASGKPIGSGQREQRANQVAGKRQSAQHGAASMTTTKTLSDTLAGTRV